MRHGWARDELRVGARFGALTTPPIRYSEKGDVHIAYQVVGAGPVGSRMRHGRGMGLSDRVRAGTLEERMDDVRAILDNIGSESAALMGIFEGGPMSILFAATCPEPTRAVVLVGGETRR